MSTTETNALAAEVQAEQTDVLVLWEAVRRYAYGEAVRWDKAFHGCGGVTVDDLMQAAYLALVDAIDRWNAQRGSFLGIYRLCLKGHFTAAYRRRNDRGHNDLLDDALSLDMPLNNEADKETALADIIHDPAAEKAFRGIEQAELVTAVRWALSMLPKRERQAIINYFWRGQKVRRETRLKALRLLRRPEIAHVLLEHWR